MASRSSLPGGAGMEMEAKRWDTESGKMLAHYRGGCTQPITTVAFSPSGKLLFTDGGEGPFVVWDIASGGQISDPASALKADWGPVVAASAPAAFVPVEKAALTIRPGGQRLARVAVAQCHPFTIAETGLWDDIPASLHEATVYEPPLAGKSQSRNVVEVDVLEGGALALAAAWGTEPGDPASSINDADLVTEQQLTARGWKPTGTITRTYPGGAPDKQRIFARVVKTGEKFRLATRNVTPPFVIIGDVKLPPNAGGSATTAETRPTTPALPQSGSRKFHHAKGIWAEGDGWLVSPGDPIALLQLSDHPPNEYTVSLARTASHRKGDVCDRPPAGGGGQALVAVDASSGNCQRAGKPGRKTAESQRGSAPEPPPFPGPRSDDYLHRSQGRHHVHVWQCEVLGLAGRPDDIVAPVGFCRPRSEGRVSGNAK